MAQLPPDEIKRRIAAARILRGIKQAELEDQLASDGLGKRELGRVERGELPLTKIRREAIAGALGVPEHWFQAESVDTLLGMEPGAWEPGDVLSERMTALDTALRGAAQALRQDREQGSGASDERDLRAVDQGGDVG